MSLRRTTFELACRRLTRSLGYRGNHPQRAFEAGILGALLLDVVATSALVAYIRGQGADPAAIEALVPTTALICAYSLAGPVLLLAESARGHDSSLERVLATLPLRPTTVRVYLWVPPLSIALMFVGLMVPPAVAALVVARVPVISAVLAVLTTVAVATGTVAVFLMLTKITLRGPRWASIHYPVALLGFMLALSLVIASVVDLKSDVSALDRVLVLPLVLAEIQQLSTITAATGVPILIGATVVSSVALGITARSAAAEGGQDPLLRWRPTKRPNPIAADLLYLLRSPSLVSNLLGVMVVNVGIVVLLLRMSPDAAGQLVTPLLTVMPMTAGILTRMLRGMFRTTNPPHQFAGVPVQSWVRRLNLCASLIFAAAMLPATAILGRPDLVHALGLGTFCVAWLSCLSVSLLLTWALPGSTEDPASQIVAAVVYLLFSSLALWLMQTIAGFSMPLAIAIAAGLLLAVIASSPHFEGVRWQPTSRQQDTAVSPTKENHHV